MARLSTLESRRDFGSSARLSSDLENITVRSTSQDYQSTPDVAEMLVVVVEWSIIKDREDDFLRYWSEREVIQDRSGLVSEFLSRVRDEQEIPFMTWSQRQDCTTYLNVGIWRDCKSFVDQIGPKLTRNGEKLPFEYEPRRRIFLGPERWRLGGSLLPTKGHADVL